MSSKDQQSLTLSHATVAHALNASDWFSFTLVMHIVQVLAINKYYLSPQIRQLALKLGTFPFILSPLRRYLFIVFNSLNISQIQEKLRFENVSFCFTRNVKMNWKLTVCIRPVCRANSDRLNPGRVFSKFSSQPDLKVPSVQGFHSDKYPES